MKHISVSIEDVIEKSLQPNRGYGDLSREIVFDAFDAIRDLARVAKSNDASIKKMVKAIQDTDINSDNSRIVKLTTAIERALEEEDKKITKLIMQYLANK